MLSPLFQNGTSLSGTLPCGPESRPPQVEKERELASFMAQDGPGGLLLKSPTGSSAVATAASHAASSILMPPLGCNCAWPSTF